MAVLTKDTIWKLTGCVQHYPWGGKNYISGLMCLTNENDKPFAELWFGQHPSCPSMTTGGTSLAELMQSSPENFLNPSERKRWNDELPFLCKILDVSEMLSIQIHPAQAEAIEGFQKEEAEGISISARKRTFRDCHHKPELMYALSDFYLLHDFRTDDEVIRVLSGIASLSPVLKKIKEMGLPDFYRWYMEQTQKRINKLLQPFVDGLLESDVPDDPMNPDYWARRAIDRFCTSTKIDRGIISFYLMNLVFLRPGEVIFQNSGIPHAYLRGQNIEVMANSDNVIRGGLTGKFINSRALSQLVRFDERTVHKLKPQRADDSKIVFTPPVDEFQLSVIGLQPYQEYSVKTSHVTLIFSTCNCFMIASQHQELRVGGGEAVLVRADETVVLRSRMKAQIFLVNSQD